MIWHKIFRKKNGRLTDDCSRRISEASENACCFLLMNRDRRAWFFLGYKAFIDNAELDEAYTHYCIIDYPLED